MHCPECGLEYGEDSVHCEDCEVVLVGDSSEEEEEESEPVEFQRLVGVADVADFTAVTTRLEDEGIPWFVQNESGPAVEIYVAANRLPEALVVLESAVGAGVQS